MTARTHVLVLRTCNPDMTSHGRFRWPEKGPVEAPDWSPAPQCGGGLHGLLWGEGNAELLSWDHDARWLVVKVAAGDVVDLDGKVKFPRGEVVYSGDRLSATAWLVKRAPGRAVVGASVTAGDRGTATAGDCGTATAGDGGTATAGNGGTATAGDRGTATAGDDGTATTGDHGTATTGDHGTATTGDHGTATTGYRGTATAGYCGTATAGNRGTATTGDHGTATAGYCGTATAGNDGTATTGYCGTATAGDRGTATTGDHGTATAGNDGTATAGNGGTATTGYRGVIQIAWRDNRRRIAVGYIGENGLQPNVAYRCNERGEFVAVEQ